MFFTSRRQIQLFRWIQLVCPSPARYVQEIVMRNGWKTGLDVGCGKHSILTALRPCGFRSTGIDVSSAMLDQARREDAHDEYIEGNFLEFQPEGKFDVIVLSEVVEHFTKEDGLKALKRAEDLASKLVYVSSPNGFLEQPELDGNPYQKHLSGWNVKEFEARGYKVFGIGVKGLRGPAGRAVLGMEMPVRLIERLTRWFVFRHPKAGFELGAVKRFE